MARWHRGDAEKAIGIKREEINRALSYKTSYDAEEHNICLALIAFKDGKTDVLAAYSNDSAIPESLRLHLDLVPNLYPNMPEEHRFGCDGRAQYHTEPKLLNYLCAAPAIRTSALRSWLPRHALYKAVLGEQRADAKAKANRLRKPSSLASVTLITEIDCCKKCVEYSIKRFRHNHGDILDIIELHKLPKARPPQYQVVSITHMK